MTTKVRDVDGAEVLPASRARWAVGFGLFALLISLGFFWEGRRAGFSSLSGDQFNILTVAAKKDYPHLLQGDLVVGDPRSVDYYIPAFVDLIRLSSLPDHNYLRGLNILLLATSLLYLWGWWLLFSTWGDRWVAAVLAFLARGIMWPPGNELWGIAGLWTMLPRTLFLALLPWALWVWIRGRQSRTRWLVACLLCGLLVNIHPISGVCAVAALLLAEFVWGMAERRGLRAVAGRCLVGGAAVLVGMAPFIWTYLSMLGSTKGIDPAEFYRTAQMRINPIFWNPWAYLQLWLQPKWLTLILLPWAACFLLPRRELAIRRNTILALGAFALGCVLTALLPFLIEGILHRYGYQARFAFQLVRACKYLVIPSMILMALLLTVASREAVLRYKVGRGAVIGVSCLVILLTLFSRSPVFNNVPVLGDDVSRFLWPTLSGPDHFIRASGGERTEQNLDATLRWIRENTPEDAKFVGPRQIRAGALRPVIHDFAGAGMLIEGNPKAYLEAARRERLVDETEPRGPVPTSELYASWGADYWVTQVFSPELQLAYTGSGWFVYDLRGGRRELTRR